MGKRQLPPWASTVRRAALSHYREVYHRKRDELERRILIHRLTGGEVGASKYDIMTTSELRSRAFLKYYAGVETEDEMWATPTNTEEQQ